MITAEFAQECIDSCECPYCNDGKVYRVLPLHIYQAHGITAYEFRRQFGWNRRHPLSSAGHRLLRRQSGKRNYKDNKGFREYDQREAVRNRYRDGGKRDEARQSDRRVSSEPERVAAFLKHVAPWLKPGMRGIGDKRTKVPRADWPAIVAAYEAGRTQRSIAAGYGVTQSSIHKVIKTARAEV